MAAYTQAIYKTDPITAAEASVIAHLGKMGLKASRAQLYSFVLKWFGEKLTQLDQNALDGIAARLITEKSDTQMLTLNTDVKAKLADVGPAVEALHLPILWDARRQKPLNLANKRGGYNGALLLALALLAWQELGGDGTRVPEGEKG
jgi:hypothetical protein